MDVTREFRTGSRKSEELKAPMIQFAWKRTYVTPEVKGVVRISVSSLWSLRFVGLVQDAHFISYPSTDDRYMVIWAMNMWTDDFLSAVTR